MNRIKWALAVAAIGLAGAALANVQQGVDAWRDGDFASAVAQWQPLADAGDPDAQFNLGQAYKLGRGVPQDMERAKSLFASAAQQGHLQAESNYGLMLFQEGQREDAMPWLIRAANRGEARSQYIYGTALYNGDLAEQDWPRAYAMMTRAAAQGVPQAASSLELMNAQIPADQREQGQALAARLEQDASTFEVASATPPPGASQPAVRAAPPPREVQATPPQQTAQVQPDANWALPPAAPPPRTQRSPEPGTTPVVQQPTAPTPQPVQTARRGDWRIQLGSFSERARAERHWRDMSRVSGLSGLQPFLVSAGPYTRLQAGPFRTESEASQACAAARRAGSDCITARRR